MREEIVRFSESYVYRFETHPNVYALNLLDNSDNFNRLNKLNILELRYRVL